MLKSSQKSGFHPIGKPMGFRYKFITMYFSFFRSPDNTPPLPQSDVRHSKVHASGAR